MKRVTLLAAVLVGAWAWRFWPLEAASPVSFRFEEPGWRATVTGERLTFWTSRAEERPLEFGAPRLTRGERVLGAGAGSSRQVGARLEVSRGEYVTRFEASPEGLELSWAFERAPSGAGDLVVSLPVLSGDPTLDDDGARWSSARMGAATWVDALGRRTRVRAETMPGALRYAIPAEVLEGSAFPAVLDPVLRPAEPQPIDLGGAGAPRTGHFENVGVAFDGRRWLAVWLVGRDLEVMPVEFDGGVGFPMRTLVASPVRRAAVAGAAGSAQGGFLVVWEGLSGALSAQFIASRGNPTSMSFTLAGSSAEEPTVAYSAAGDGGYLVMWANTSNSSVEGVWVTDRTGQRKQVDAMNSARQPSVACGAAECLIAVTTSSSTSPVVAALWHPGMVPPGPPTYLGPVVLAVGGVTWSSPRAWVLPNARVVAAVSSSGGATGVGLFAAQQPLGSFVPVMALAPVPFATAPVLSCSHHVCTVLVEYRSSAAADAGVARLDFDFVGSASPTLTQLSTPEALASTPSLAAGAGTTLATWTETVDGDRMVVGSFFDGGALFPLSINMASQSSLVLAPGDGGVLAVWVDQRSDFGDVRGRVLLLDGGFAGDAFDIFTAPGRQVAPAAVWTGGSWLVAASNVRRRRLEFVEVGGTASTPRSGFVDVQGDLSVKPRLAAAQGIVLMAWNEGAEIRGASIDLAAPMTPANSLPSFTLAVGCGDTAVASDGRRWLLVSTCRQGTTAEARRQEWTPDGGQRLPSLTTVQNGQLSDPTLVFGDGTFFAAWTRTQGQASVEGALFSDGGMPLVLDLDDGTSAGARAPAVAWSKWGFVVSWYEAESNKWNVRAARVRGTHVARLGEPVLADVASVSAPPAVACLAPGRCVIGAVSPNAAGAMANAGNRVVFRWLINEPPDAGPAQVVVVDGGPTAFAFSAVDPEGDPLVYAITEHPSFGTVVVDGGSGTYSPSAWVGSDMLDFAVSDGIDDSTGRVRFEVIAPSTMAGGSAGGGSAGGGSAGGGSTGGGSAGGDAPTGGGDAGGAAREPIVLVPVCGCTSAPAVWSVAWVLLWAARHRARRVRR